MSNYHFEEKESFIVLGIGTDLKSDYTDYAGINKEKAEFLVYGERRWKPRQTKVPGNK